MSKPSETFDDPWVWAESPSFKEEETPRSGKWMIFISQEHHDATWEVIRVATESGELGFLAKAATAFENPLRGAARSLLTCVYTNDYSNHEDVRRVLVALRQLGFTGRLSYKADNDTRSGNYGKGVSLFVSQPDSEEFEVRRTPD
jgi:hypothetical protein